ncbi:hypothetical protein [Glutamicibacter uratoxydans]|uniref:hypothetical protein n=1 Tax=Glutamicibacter uratoxydans TaxID=43667 RepID=UPI00114412F5|nr:hypothetical protein [Glutamicibacter uratoxydans]
MKAHFLGASAVIGVSALLLSGCTSATGIPALDREAQEADRWPGDPTQLDDTGMDINTSRFLISNEGTDYYVLTSSDQKMACLFVFDQNAADEFGGGGCGGVTGAPFLVGVELPGHKMALVRNDARISDYEAEGWKQIHENIFVGDS